MISNPLQPNTLKAQKMTLLSNNARLGFFTIAASVVLLLIPIKATAQPSDLDLLERALAKQATIPKGIAYTVHYQSDAWQAEFIARHTPLNVDMPWQILSLENPTPEQTAQIMELIETEALSDLSMGLNEDAKEDYPGLKVSELAGKSVYDFGIELDVDGRNNPVRGRVRVAITVDPDRELVTHTRVYNTKGFRLSTAARVKSLELETLYTPLEGFDAAAIQLRRSNIIGKAFLVTDWTLDYVATYSDFILPD